MARHGRFAYVFLFLTLLVTGGLYWVGLSGGYSYDDYHVLVYNPFLNLKNLNLPDLVRASSSFQAGGRELSMLSFALNQYFLGDSPWGYKLVNVVVHCLNGILLYLLLSRLTNIHQDTVPDTRNDFIRHVPLAAVALWLVHPINLSAVLYISQRMTQLSTFFILLGLISYVWARCENLPLLRRRIYPPLVLLVYTAFGYQAKENAALLPIFAFVVELTVLKFRSFGQRDRWIVSMYAAGALSIVVFVIGKFWLDPQWLTEGYRNRHFTLEERVLTQFRVLVFYLVNMVAPTNSSLGFWHDDMSISKGLLSPPTTLACLALLLGLLGTAIISVKRFPLLALGLMWFFVSHLIESTFLALELVHEHRNYLASFGIVLALVVVFSHFCGQKREVFSVLCVGLFLFFSIVLGQRSYLWGDEFRHAEHEVRSHPESASANYILARKHYERFLQDKGNDSIRKVLQYGTQASVLEQYSIAPEILLMYLGGNTDVVPFESAWIERAVEKLRDHPYIVSSRQSLKDFVRCLASGNCHIPHEAILPLLRVAEDSDRAHLLTSVGNYWMRVANDPERAEQSYKRALRQHSGITWINYLNVLIHNGKTEQACDLYRKFRNLYENYGFKNIELQVHRVHLLEIRLYSCMNPSQSA